MCSPASPGRRTAVSAAELMEFETQAECLGWSKPHLFNTDHGETFTATKKGTDSTDENDPLSSFKNKSAYINQFKF